MFTIANRELKALLKERGEIVKKGRVISGKQEELKKEMDKNEQELNKLGLKLQKIQDKVMPIYKKEIEDKVKAIDEFEELDQIEIKGDKIIVTTYNRVEEFKKHYREAKKNENSTGK